MSHTWKEWFASGWKFPAFPKAKEKTKQTNPPNKQKPLEILEVTEIINCFP